MRFILALALLSQLAWSQAVTIRSDEWFPMNGKPDAALPGYMIELAIAAFGEVDYKLMPWVRSLEEVRTGRVDCVVGADVKDVPGFVLPTEPWGYTEIAVYAAQDQNWQYLNIESLLNKKVGVVKGYTYGDPVDSLIPKYPAIFKAVAGSDGLERNIKQVVSKRLDALIASTFVAEAIINDMNLVGSIKKVGVIGKPLPMYIACSPANEHSIQLVDQVDRTTRRLRESGELEAILNRYGLSDWRLPN